MSLDETTLRNLIDAGRILEANDMGDLTRGHEAIRLPGQPDRFVMKPHSYGSKNKALGYVRALSAI